MLQLLLKLIVARLKYQPVPFGLLEMLTQVFPFFTHGHPWVLVRICMQIDTHSQPEVWSNEPILDGTHWLVYKVNFWYPQIMAVAPFFPYLIRYNFRTEPSNFLFRFVSISSLTCFNATAKHTYLSFRIAWVPIQCQKQGFKGMWIYIELSNWPELLFFLSLYCYWRFHIQPFTWLNNKVDDCFVIVQRLYFCRCLIQKLSFISRIDPSRGPWSTLKECLDLKIVMLLVLLTR